MAKTTGERLKLALEWAGLNQREFKERLNEHPAIVTKRKQSPAGTTGTSAATIGRYLSGDSEPGVEFLKATAAITGVSSLWLTHEAGEMLAGDLVTADRSLHDVVGAESDDEIHTFNTLFSEGAGGHAGFRAYYDDMTPFTKAAYHNALARWLYSLGPITLDEMAARACELGALIVEPEQRFGTRDELREDGRRRGTDFRLAQVLALMLAMPERKEGTP